MLLNPTQLQTIHAELFQVDRGGDITYHGPGQWVCYPILNLEDFHLGLKEYLHLLEEAVIRVCRTYGIEVDRVHGATGVWLATGTPEERKICAMGGKKQPFRYDARSCPERQYRFKVFQLHSSLWVYRQGSHFTTG